MEADAINQQIRIIQGTSPEQDPYLHSLKIRTHPLPSEQLDNMLKRAEGINYLTNAPELMHNLHLPLFMQEYFKPVVDEIIKQFGESVDKIEFLNMSAEFGGEELDMGEYRTSCLPMSCGYLITFKGKDGAPPKKVFGPMVATDLKLLFELREVDGLDAEDLLKLQVGFGYRHLEAMQAELDKEPQDREYNAIYYSFPAITGFENGKTNLILKALEATLKKKDQGNGKSKVTVQFGDLLEDEIRLLECIAEIHNQHFLEMIRGKIFTESEQERKKYMKQFANALFARAGNMMAGLC